MFTPLENESAVPPSEASLEEVSTKRSRWSPEEDSTIIRLHDQGTSWSDISLQVSGRSKSGCKNRYTHHLRWLEAEDPEDKLARLYELYVRRSCTRL